MSKTEYQFSTQGEADAFRQGIELANDSALSVGPALEYPDNDVQFRFVVVVVDQDGEEEDDDEGYMGTGMSESAYFTAAGSAEFL